MEKGELELDRIKKKIQEYWDREREHAFFEDDAEEEAWKNVLYAEFGREKQKILDVGTGNGSLALLLAEMGHDVVGIDISEGMLSVAIEKAKERGVNPDFMIGDAESLDFEDECFDAVVSRVVLWTLPHYETAISEWRRVLKPSGKVYAFEMDPFGRRNQGWIKRNLGLFLITIIERRNAWKTEHYSKDTYESLPLSHDKASANVINKVELFRKCGFEDVTVFNMEKVNAIERERWRKAPLRSKLAWDLSEWMWYYIRGCKPR